MKISKHFVRFNDFVFLYRDAQKVCMDTRLLYLPQTTNCYLFYDMRANIFKSFHYINQPDWVFSKTYKTSEIVRFHFPAIIIQPIISETH